MTKTYKMFTGNIATLSTLGKIWYDLCSKRPQSNRERQEANVRFEQAKHPDLVLEFAFLLYSVLEFAYTEGMGHRLAKKWNTQPTCTALFAVEVVVQMM